MKKILTLMMAFAMVFCVYTAMPTATVQTAYAVVLQQGNSGSSVKTLQTKLKNWGYYTGGVDGVFGAKTTTAVKSFQRKNKLTADGIVGQKTANAMAEAVAKSTGTPLRRLCLKI